MQIFICGLSNINVLLDADPVSFAYWGWAWGSHNGGFRGVHVFPFLSAQSVWPQLLLEVGPAVKTPVGTSMNSSLPYTLLFYLLVWFSVVFGGVNC